MSEPTCKLCGYVHLPEHHINYQVGEDGLCSGCHDALAGNDGKDNYGRPRIDYYMKLQEMSDKELQDETESMIYMSAYAKNNSRSDYHWQCDATYNECSRRGKPEIYKRAHKSVSASV